MPSATFKLRVGAAILAASAGLALSAIPASAAPAKADALPDGPALARQLVNKVKGANINRHLIAMQRFSDSTGGSRAASTEGHRRSAEYIAGKAEAAGFTVTRQEFPFTFTEKLAERLAVGGTNVPISIMTYSPSTPVGGLTAPLAVVPAGADATPGCEASDYAGVDVAGKVALISRGGCTFFDKQANAAAAGAVAAVIYNNVPGGIAGTLGAVGTIPTGGITQADGAALIGQAGAATTVELRALLEDRTSYNVIAETKTGRKDNVVMAGAHLDSVTEGAGINDNGSGSGALLETALQLGGSPKVNNTVRFAWWSAEEFGLVGSTYYVQQLPFEEQLNIALYLNFDMIASPNAAYFVYDGDDSDQTGAGPGPYGSAQIEQAFHGFLNTTGTPTEGTDFSGRSDYGEFIAVGIPSGGLFTGAEGVKTEAQAAKWGGRAGVAYDPCYHSACDNLGNLDRVALDRNADAIAWVTASYAISTEDVNGVPPRAQRAQARLASMRMAKVAHADAHGHVAS